MIAGVRLKICGLTSLVDAGLADEIGADYLGFILHPGSSRYVSVRDYEAMRPRLPERPHVAVMVAPDGETLAAARAAGFARFQIHFEPDTPAALLRSWTVVVGRERLWLAPRLPPGTALSPFWFEAAGTLLIDTYHAGGYGGSGRTGDWGQFGVWREAYPAHDWVLAGGLRAENVGEALTASGARFIDVGSGVEAAPGIKDAGKMRALAAALRVVRRGH
jgi:phosphoribosylanthranilate isomerase